MLNALLEYGKNTDPIDLLSAKDNITVHPEYVFENGRRIDILVIAGKYIIAMPELLSECNGHCKVLRSLR